VEQNELPNKFLVPPMVLLFFLLLQFHTMVIKCNFTKHCTVLVPCSYLQILSSQSQFNLQLDSPSSRQWRTGYSNSCYLSF